MGSALQVQACCTRAWPISLNIYIKKGLNNRGENWPAENLMLETVEMVL